MKYTAIDWFHGVCYAPKFMDGFRKANPAITNDRLHLVYSALPKLKEEEISDLSKPTNRIVDINVDNTSTYFDMGDDYLNRPHGLSVACFDKEVLSKYGAFCVEGSLVWCDDWALRDVYINDAGQVHVCICDLASSCP